MIKSVELLQKYLNANGAKLRVDNDLGDNTKAAINALNIPDYLKTALYEVGVKEIKGSKHNPRVIYYHSFTGRYSTDEVAWCGSFIAMCMSVNHYILPKYGERAKTWATYGKSVSSPTIGSIAVKSRTGGGHVCIVIGSDSKGNLYCVGGNQGDEVNIKLYPKNAFIDFRIPIDAKEYPLNKYNLEASATTSEA